MTQKSEPKIIVSIDADTISQAWAQIHLLNPNLCHLKIGSILFTRYGPSFVEKLIHKGYRIFLDLKFHDIPQIVTDACLAAAELGVWMINIHVSGGRLMMENVVNVLKSMDSNKKPLILGVTILTSLDNNDLKALGIRDNVSTMVSRMAILAKTAGLDGVVCSAHEASFLRHQCGEDFLLVTPGIRLKNNKKHDQKRTMTPEVALKAGSDYLVIGRSVTQSHNPLQILQMINHSLAAIVSANVRGQQKK
ncbi:orotidine-5'-phosphate decarboxylase [Coxiella endosymbiont of Amblyomma nuttalli]|uniref:orotidine-5'-phosphate decarboxylase n=1 Tax=Coxiella endosymbiont of Amblyomma nuttalli TaxID=2749996 RepID=UPI001BAB9ACD|nr:orotidine-5'-phosphate decarboxylase [Coxiella endosymbiont of Amblyomma nuttalli]QTS83875.1 Orotidine 5'-phosphate decarboxylase [Coxiella endosymbiont of Amblyomma nuttalli]